MVISLNSLILSYCSNEHINLRKSHYIMEVLGIFLQHTNIQRLQWNSREST